MTENDLEKEVNLLNKNDDHQENEKKVDGEMKEIGKMQRGGSGEMKERCCFEDQTILKTSPRMQDRDMPSVASSTLYVLNHLTNQMTEPLLEDSLQLTQVSSNLNNTNLTTGRAEHDRLGPANRNEIWRSSCYKTKHKDILTEMNEVEEMNKPSEDDF